VKEIQLSPRCFTGQLQLWKDQYLATR